MEGLSDKLYRSGFFHLLAWVAAGVVGAVERFNSPMFEQWLHQNSLEVQNQGYEPNVFDFLGTTPPFVLALDLLAAILCMGVFGLIRVLLRKRLPKVLAYLILIFPACFVVFTGYIAAVDFIENLTWRFYILAIQGVIWFSYLIFIVMSCWRLMVGPRVS